MQDSEDFNFLNDVEIHSSVMTMQNALAELAEALSVLLDESNASIESFLSSVLCVISLF
jgi:hypothetical protein